MSDGTAKHWGAQLAGGVTLLAVVVIPASVVALVLNVRAGLEISIEAAVIYGLADIALVTVALVASVCGHVTISRAAVAACAMLSLVSQVNAHMSNAGHAMRLAGEQNQALARAITKIDEAKDEARMARDQAVIARNHAEAARQNASEIAERGTAPDLTDAARRASGKADAALKTAARAKKACRDAPECLAAQNASTTAKAALAQAHSKAALLSQATSEEARAKQFDEDARRADAKAEKAEASRAEIGGPAKVDGTVNFLSHTYGWDEATVGRWISAGKTGLLLTATLILQMLGGYAGQAINEGVAGRRAAKAAVAAKPVDVVADAQDAAEVDPLTQSLLEAVVEDMWAEFTEFGGRMADDVPDTTGATHITPVADEAPMLEVAAAPVATEQAGGQKADASKKNRERGLRAAATRKANILAQEKAAEAARLELEAKAEEARTALDAVKKVRQEAAQKGAQTKARSKKSRLGSGVRCLAVVGRLTANDNGK